VSASGVWRVAPSYVVSTYITYINEGVSGGCSLFVAVVQSVPLGNLEMFEGTGIILRSFSSPMLSFLTAVFATLSSVFRSRSALQLENLALRHQIGVLQRVARKRPK